MKDSHLTSPLERSPFRQYRITELEEDDFAHVGDELCHVMRSRAESADYEVLKEYLRAGGRIAIASRLLALEAPHGPSDLEVEAVAALSPTMQIPRVYQRDAQTPHELVRYLESYLATVDPEHVGPSLDRLPPAHTYRDEPRTVSYS